MITWDVNNPLWLVVEAQMKNDLEKYRLGLESSTNSPESTAALRGKIAYIRGYLEESRQIREKSG